MYIKKEHSFKRSIKPTIN